MEENSKDTATTDEAPVPSPNRSRRFVGRKRAEEQGQTQTDGVEEGSQALAPAKKERPRGRRTVNAVPQEILEDAKLNEAIAQLPANYSFEIHKTIWRLRQAKATRVALQFPEGLQIFAVTISDIVEQFVGADTVVLGDVTYGACCVDDFTAQALGCDFLVHYGHSCLVPTDVTEMPTMYVFVTISFDIQHLIDTVLLNFPDPTTRLAVLGTIQFAASLPAVKAALKPHFDYLYIPQTKPLSPGETLGCTSPKLEGVTALVFVCDGRFHLEAVLISHPGLPAFKYDPYSKAFTIETYDHAQMHQLRRNAIDQARQASRFGIILGTLGRQGAPHLLTRLEGLLKAAQFPYTIVLLSEIFPSKLEMFEEVDAWIQIACPRLSIDWGYAFKKPLLSPYEAEVTLRSTEWKDVYPMDFYSSDGGNWKARKEPQRRAAASSKQLLGGNATEIGEAGPAVTIGYST